MIILLYFGTGLTVWYFVVFFLHFSIELRNCSDSVVFSAVFFISLLYFGTGLTVWYFVGFFLHFSIGLRNCSDSMVLFFFFSFLYWIEERF